MDTNRIVAMHEAGHVLALAAAGIYSELVSVDLGRAQYEGSTVLGLTIRNGQSLTDFSLRLGNMSARLANGSATPSEYAEFMIKNALDCCFPHICFFAGGYAIESCWNHDDPNADSRAAIDKKEIREKVLPAMGLANASEELFARFWNWGVEFVKDAIAQNEEIALRLVDNIFRHGQHGLLNKNSIDVFFAADAGKIACDTGFKRDSFVSMKKEMYAEEFRTANQRILNV